MTLFPILIFALIIFVLYKIVRGLMFCYFLDNPYRGFDDSDEE